MDCVIPAGSVRWPRPLPIVRAYTHQGCLDDKHLHVTIFVYFVSDFVCDHHSATVSGGSCQSWSFSRDKRLDLPRDNQIVQARFLVY